MASADQTELEAALGAVVDPELNLTLGELGVVRSVRTKRRRALLEVALPVAAWPSVDALAEEIHRVALAVPGVEEVELDFVVMGEDERGRLRQLLRAGMLGVDPDAAPDDDEGHDHAGTATATRRPHRCRSSSARTPGRASSACPRARGASASRRSR